MRTDAKKENSRAHRINDGDKRYERNAHPGKKFTYVFQSLPLAMANGDPSSN
jgi:hypothetical protein